MNSATLKRAVIPALMSGTRRTGFDVSKLGVENLQPGDSNAVLKALSLCGQALRFERAAAPAQFAVETWPNDERPIVPDALRPLILRLLSGSKCTEDSALSLAWALDRHKLRPHPFDIPRMDGFVKQHATHLGVTAQHWAQREVPPDRQHGYFDADELNRQNWTQAPPARRAQFLEKVREHNPSAARSLLEATWPQEPAETRLRLLAAIEAGLSEEDKPFLEGLSKDRAPRIKMLAQRLLSRLPGAHGSSPALVACLGRIQKSQTGLLRKRLVLKLELPATIKEHAANRWVVDQFADVGLDELAHALDANPEEMVPASEKDHYLLFALSLMASRERRFDLLEKIVAGPLPDVWGLMSQSGFDDLEFTRAEDRQRWAEVAVRPTLWMPEATYLPWNWLHKRVAGSLPPRVMKEVLHAKSWLEQLSSDIHPATEQVQAFCALCPRELRATLRQQIAPLEVDRNEKGLQLLEILDRLEQFQR